jgi:hypothetical protein
MISGSKGGAQMVARTEWAAGARTIDGRIGRDERIEGLS